MSFCRNDGACEICDATLPSCDYCADRPAEFEDDDGFPICDDCSVDPADEPEEDDAPEEFGEWEARAARDFRYVADRYHEYETRGWASPISGDATTIRSKFL